MFRQFFAGLESPALPLAAMLFFFAVFAVVVVRLVAGGRRAEDRAAAELPLEDDRAPSEPEVTP